MAAKDNDTILKEISNHINEQGGKKSSWYVGIASDIRQRLHGDHRVPEDNHWFIWREALSSNHARDIENAFINWGCDGGPGGGNNTTKYVYAYLKSNVTDP